LLSGSLRRDIVGEALIKEANLYTADEKLLMKTRDLKMVKHLKGL